MSLTDEFQPPAPRTDGPILFCSDVCLRNFVAEDQTPAEHHFECAEDGCCSACGVQFLSTPVRHDVSDATSTAVQSTIDEFLARVSGRNLWSTNEVTDVFLDIRLLLRGDL